MLKLIHTADLHLDAALTGLLPEEAAKKRRDELLMTFERMILYCETEGIQGMLISGDLFDTGIVQNRTRNVVLAAIRKHPDVRFFYLRGNHDTEDCLNIGEEIPENLCLFSDEWTSYRMGRIVITGAEFTDRNRDSLYDSLSLNADDINIVMMHGQIREQGNASGSHEISLRRLAHHHIDYLALGHVHSYHRGPLDGRGVYVYPGCPEGRGFDECNEKGFSELTIDEKTGKIESRFVPFQLRMNLILQIPVDGIMTTPELLERVEEIISEKGISKKSLLKLVYTGSLQVTGELDTAYVDLMLSEQFFFVKSEEQFRREVDLESYLEDRSLRGTFIRLLFSEVEDSKERAEIANMGLKALSGEGELL